MFRVIKWPQGYRVVRSPDTGAQPPVTKDEQLMVWQADRIIDLEAQLKEALVQLQFRRDIPVVPFEG